jgi:hypothetical protein
VPISLLTGVAEVLSGIIFFNKNNNNNNIYIYMPEPKHHRSFSLFFPFTLTHVFHPGSQPITCSEHCVDSVHQLAIFVLLGAPLLA